MSDRHLLLVVGVGRSGTSLLTGILGQLGFRLPQPEVQADHTNPRGFGEPQWVVDFHHRLLRQRRVTVNDARPAAWEATGAAAEVTAVRDELRQWLSRELDAGEVVVVKDPRTAWFMPLWTRCAADLGIETSFITMLRHPAEIVASAVKSYGTWQTEASRAAAWVNVTLETERTTRGAPRAFVRYEDLLSDWAGQLQRVGAGLGSPVLAALDRQDHPAVERFVDPSLHRNRVTWEDLSVPASVRALAEDVWQEVARLAVTEADATGSLAALDASRDAYRRLYGEAEAIAQSSITAAKPRRSGAAKPAPSLRMRLTRRVPVRYRRGLRRAVSVLRGS